MQIRWEKRNKDDKGRILRTTVDGTDFRVQICKPFNKAWWSYKFKGAGLHYEVAMSIQGGDIVAMDQWPISSRNND